MAEKQAEEPIRFADEDAVVIRGRGVLVTGHTDRAFADGDECAAFYLGKRVRVQIYESGIVFTCAGVERFMRGGPFHAGESIGLLIGPEEVTF